MKIFISSIILNIIFGSSLFFYPYKMFSQNNQSGKPHILNKQLLQGERIFFIRKYDVAGLKVGDIYSINPQGGDIQQLTNYSENYAGTELPQLSHDGTKLAFISNFESWKSKNYTDAFLLDLISGEIKRITGHEKTSPTTNTATVNVTVKDPRGYASYSDIRISYRGCKDFVKGHQATLTVPADEEIWIKAEVAKSKGDTKIVTIPAGGNQTVELDLTRGTLSAESCSPSFSGDYLAVSENSQAISNDEGEVFSWYKILLWDTKTKKELVEVGGYKMGADITPAFSPDDKFLAMCTGELAQQAVGVVPTDNITSLPTLIAYGNILGHHSYCSNPKWSPNGQEIAYEYITITVTIFGIELKSNIYKVPKNGGDPTQLTFYSGKEVATKPCYSPNGSKIAYTHSVSNGSVFTLTDFNMGNYSSNIYTISSTGGNETALTHDGNSLDPSWGIVNSTVGIEKESLEIPNEFTLSQNYPNPFNPTTTIEFSIPFKTNVDLKIFDILGNELETVISEEKNTGKYMVMFHAIDLTSGVYFYKLVAGDPSASSGVGFIETKKMLLLK